MRVRDLALVGGLALAASVASGCSARPGSGVAGSAGDAGAQSLVSDTSSTGPRTGSVGMFLSIGSGVTFQALAWTITGPAGPYSGNVPIGNASSIEFVTGGIKAGGPYTMSLTGTDSAGDPCSGSAQFSVTAGAISAVALTISCFYPTDAGIPADVTPGNGGADGSSAPVYDCPVVSGLAVSPAAVQAAQGAQLDVSTTTAPGGSPATETFMWAASPQTAGTFDDPTSPTPVFTCVSPGPVTLTVTVGLSAWIGGVDAGNVCSGAAGSVSSGTVDCEGASEDAGGGD